MCAFWRCETSILNILINRTSFHWIHSKHGPKTGKKKDLLYYFVISKGFPQKKFPFERVLNMRILKVKNLGAASSYRLTKMSCQQYTPDCKHKLLFVLTFPLYEDFFLFLLIFCYYGYDNDDDTWVIISMLRIMMIHDADNYRIYEYRIVTMMTSLQDVSTTREASWGTSTPTTSMSRLGNVKYTIKYTVKNSKLL